MKFPKKDQKDTILFYSKIIMRTFVIAIVLILFIQESFCQKPVPAFINTSMSPISPATTKNFEHDIALIKPLINTNDSNGGYYQEYWYFSFQFMYCGATVMNTGNIAATHVHLEMTIFDYSNASLQSFFSDTIAILNPGEVQTLNIPGELTFQPWTSNNSIQNMVFSVKSDSMDNNPANNNQTVPFPYLTVYNWTHVSRSINPVASRQIGQPGSFQSGDFIGFTFNAKNSGHYMPYMGFYLSEPWSDSLDITAMLYENGRLIDSQPVLMPSPPVSGWVYSNFFYSWITPDSTYYVGIKFTFPTGSSFSIGADTLAYHNFGAESIALTGGTWTSLDFIPAMEMICDPEGIPEKKINIPAVFPNPASSVLSVTNVRDAKLELFDPTGKLILSDEQITPTRTLDVSRFPSGIYFLLITSKERSIGKKVVIWQSQSN